MFRHVPIFAALFACFGSFVAGAAETCDGPEAVCRFAPYVMKLEGNRREANAVYLGAGLAAANRHVVLGRPDLIVKTGDGRTFGAKVKPSAYNGDLALLAVAGLDLGRAPVLAENLTSGTGLFVMAHEQNVVGPRIYPPGEVLLPPAVGYVLSRLQHNARGGEASEGGAILTRDGRLAGIATVGHGDRGEAIPAAQIRALIELSKGEATQTMQKLTDAYIRCMDAQRRMPIRRARLARRAVTYLTEHCKRTQNGQLIESAARILGRAGHLAEARDLFSVVLGMDPHTLGARQGLVVVLLLGGGHEAAIPHLKWLFDILPRDLEILRLSIQAGKYAGDIAFAEGAYARLQQLNPALALPMRRFLDGSEGGGKAR